MLFFRNAGGGGVASTFFWGAGSGGSTAAFAADVCAGVLPTSAGFGGDPPHEISIVASTIRATSDSTMALAHMMTEVLQLTTLAAPRRFYFGEFLVEQRILDRFQLFRALQLKDRIPSARLGQCAVALGYVHRTAIEEAHIQFALTGDNADTEAFERAEEIEIVQAL